jgi:hypothetical protein
MGAIMQKPESARHNQEELVKADASPSRQYPMECGGTPDVERCPPTRYAENHGGRAVRMDGAEAPDSGLLYAPFPASGCQRLDKVGDYVR